MTMHHSLKSRRAMIFLSRPYVSRRRHVLSSQLTSQTSWAAFIHTTSTPEQHSQTPLHVHHTAAHDFTSTLLHAYSVPPAHATLVASALTSADLRGHDTHGLMRLPSYLARVRSSLISPTAVPTLTQTTPVAAHVDARNGFGFPAVSVAMRAATDAAKVYGIGVAGVTNSNHFGMSAWVVEQAAKAGMMSLVFTNSSPALPVWGGREKFLGVSPIACGAPAGGEKGGEPWILDMAPSVAARGKVYKALRRGEKIPEGWALDRKGRATTDPAEALEGVMLPMGGPKGSGLAIMMDVFSGVLTGSGFAGGVKGPYDMSGKGRVGHFVVAIKPDLWMGMKEFKERMGELYQKVVGCERADGVDRIYMPGEIELEREKARRETGIPYTPGEIEALNKEASRVGVKEIEVMQI